MTLELLHLSRANIKSLKLCLDSTVLKIIRGARALINHANESSNTSVKRNKYSPNCSRKPKFHVQMKFII